MAVYYETRHNLYGVLFASKSMKFAERLGGQLMCLAPRLTHFLAKMYTLPHEMISNILKQMHAWTKQNLYFQNSKALFIWGSPPNRNINIVK
jgi:hypothetical protein